MLLDMRHVTYYNCCMIKDEKAIKHKGLRNFLLTGNKKGLSEKDLPKIKTILFIMTTAVSLNDFNQYPNHKLHPLKGDLKDYWSVNISGNYRIVFQFESGYFLILIISIITKRRHNINVNNARSTSSW